MCEKELWRDQTCTGEQLWLRGRCGGKRQVVVWCQILNKTKIHVIFEDTFVALRPHFITYVLPLSNIFIKRVILWYTCRQKATFSNARVAFRRHFKTHVSPKRRHFMIQVPQKATFYNACVAFRRHFKTHVSPKGDTLWHTCRQKATFKMIANH